MNKEMRGNFMFLGFKEMRLICNDDLDKTEKREFEVYFRVIIREEEEYELMFNDISDIKENEEKIAELKYKSMFLAKVAHEFKNPLICISEMATELNIINKSSDKNEFSTKSPEILRQIQSMSEYLLILIKDLDYFSNIQISKDPPKLEIEFVDLKNEVIPFCRQIGESLIHKLNKKKVKIIVENNLPLGFKFKTDEIKLKQILINLISNAVKFTNEGTIKIIANLVIIQNLIIFEVSDSGIGMTQEQLQSLGSPYNKGINKKNNYGSGLGLYIVSQILNQLGTELKCSSIIGKGTTFSFSQKVNNFFSQDQMNLIDPLQDSSLEEGDSKVLTIKLEEEELKVMNQIQIDFARGLLRRATVNNITFDKSREIYNYPQYANSETTENIFSNLGTPYYIVVDDEKFTRQATLRVLKHTANKLKINCTFVEAEDGVECISIVYNLLKDGKRIDGIISDEMMNHMNGSTTAEILKKLKNLNSQLIPFYLLSALTDFNNNYIDYFISKPIVEKEAKKIFKAFYII
jgi:signal transduction histidine kinase/CheY-like chemotaxis protein